MRSVYTGTLSDVTEGGDDLPISIVLDDAWLDIISSDRTLGRWPLDQVQAERKLANRFTLTVAGEEWDFACDSPADFAIEGIEHIANYRPSSRPGWITRLRSEIGTLGRWALASAITVSGFGVGLIMGRYHLDGANPYTASALGALLLLSLFLTRAISRQPEDEPGPVVMDWRTHHHRSPLRVDEVVGARPGIERARRREPTEPERRTGPEPGAGDQAEPDQAPSRHWAPSPSEHPPADEDGLPVEQRTPPESDRALVGAADPAMSDGDHSRQPEYETVGSGQPGEGDEDYLDLASINGIGPVFAELLNDLGVPNVRSLALLDKRGIERVVNGLGRFGKRLYTADWVGQARRRLGLEEDPELEVVSAGETDVGDGSSS